MPTIYEKRTYSVTVGQMAEVIRLYSTQGWPALEATSTLNDVLISIRGIR